MPTGVCSQSAGCPAVETCAQSPSAPPASSRRSIARRSPPASAACPTSPSCAVSLARAMHDVSPESGGKTSCRRRHRRYYAVSRMCMQLTSGTPILEAFSFPAMQPSQLLAFGAVPLSASMSCMSVIIPFKVILCDSGILYQASVTDPSWYKMEWFSLGCAAPDALQQGCDAARGARELGRGDDREAGQCAQFSASLYPCGVSEPRFPCSLRAHNIGHSSDGTAAERTARTEEASQRQFPSLRLD